MGITKSLPNNVLALDGNGLTLFLNDVDGALYVRDAHGEIELLSNYISNIGTSVLGIVNGGTSISAYAKGDILYAPANNELARLPAEEGKFLKVVSGVPSWQTISTGLIVGSTSIASGAVGRVLFEGTGNVLQEDSNFNWDNTNKTFGVGITPTATERVYIKGTGATGATNALKVVNSASEAILNIGDDRIVTLTTPNVNNTSYLIFKRNDSTSGILFSTNGLFGCINPIGINGSDGYLKIGNLADAGFVLQPHQSGVSGAKIELYDNQASGINGEKLLFAIGVNTNYVGTGLAGQAIWTRYLGIFNANTATQDGYMISMTPTITASPGKFFVLDYNPTITSLTGAHYGLAIRPVTKSGFGLGATEASAQIHISAGASTAGLAPLKLTAGTNLATAEIGAIEYDGTSFYNTNSTAVRGTIVDNRQVSDAAGTFALTNVYTRFVFTGTTTTWTCFALAGNTNKQFTIHNLGSGSITLNSSAGATDFWNGTTAVNSVTITTGQTKTVYNNGTYFIIY